MCTVAWPSVGLRTYMYAISDADLTIDPANHYRCPWSARGGRQKKILKIYGMFISVGRKSGCLPEGRFE